MNGKKDVTRLFGESGLVLLLLLGSLNTHSKESRGQRSSKKAYKNKKDSKRQRMLVLNRTRL